MRRKGFFYNRFAMFLISITAMLQYSSITFADVVIIVNPQNANLVINEKRLKNIFLGKIKTFPDDKKAIPLELANGNLRKEFRSKLLKKSDGQLEAYWARALFSGIGSPPKEFDTEAEIKELVATNPNVIAYVDRASVDASVKIINIEKESASDED